MKQGIFILLLGVILVLGVVFFLIVNIPNKNKEIENMPEIIDNMNAESTNNENEKDIEMENKILETTEEESEDENPRLKNLGIEIDSWNKNTNLAGDLLFSKSLVYDDGRVSGNKVLVDFGHTEKYRPDGIGNIEYWFHVPLGTKVMAPIDGKVTIDFFDHTEDWGVNIHPESSDLIISFEHVVNVAVKEGDMVQTGDIIGEAAPRNTFNDKIAMTELAVWRGGSGIIKYCPFDFLDESLKPIYQEKIDKLAEDWENFLGKDVYAQEAWVSPGCLVKSIQEK